MESIGVRGLDTQLRIDPATAQIVDDVDIMAKARQMQGCGPADKSVAAEYRNFH